MLGSVFGISPGDLLLLLLLVMLEGRRTSSYSLKKLLLAFCLGPLPGFLRSLPGSLRFPTWFLRFPTWVPQVPYLDSSTSLPGFLRSPTWVPPVPYLGSSGSTGLLYPEYWYELQLWTTLSGYSQILCWSSNRLPLDFSNFGIC